MNVFNIALRNLLRYQRRTILTSLLITVGIVSVLLFIAVAGSFKTLIIGDITDSMLGQLQIHKKGYVASTDTSPLNLNLTPNQVTKITDLLKQQPAVVAYTERVKFGAMFSNFTETSSLKLNGIDPEQEERAMPGLKDRVLEGDVSTGLLQKGEILVPELLAKGMKVNVGDTVVIVATNLDGSVNGQPLVVRGILEGITGPGGRDGYVHIDDARALLRMDEAQVTELAVRLESLDALPATKAALVGALCQIKDDKCVSPFEVHSWDQLSPFASIASMIDVMTLFIKIMLVSIVLISIMNVMIMAVFERVREIGTIAAIGTQPRRILALFISEGLLLGLAGTVAGTAISLAIIGTLNWVGLRMSFGRNDNLLLHPVIGWQDVAVVGLVVIVVSILASLQPALKASRMDPITALRHV